MAFGIFDILIAASSQLAADSGLRLKELAMKKIIFFIFILSNFIYPQEENIKEISLDDAIKLAIENNFDLRIEKINPAIADTQVHYQKGVFYPYLSSTLQNNSSKIPASSDLQGAPKLINDDFTYNFGLNYLSPYGTNLSLIFQNNRTKTNSVFSTINPRFNSNLSLELSQPLLKNFGKNNVQYLLIQAKNNKQIADYNYKQKVLDLILAVQQAYWDVVFAYEDYKVKQASLELAKKLLQDTQTQVDIGSVAPIEILSAKAEVAKREEELIAAENLITKNENYLKLLIDGNDEANNLLYKIKPVDKPKYEKLDLELNSLIEIALANRPELNITDVNIKMKENDEKYYRNALLPSLNFKLGVGLNGLGGDRLIYSEGFLNRKVIGKISGGYSDALDQLFSGDYNNWSIGIELTYPILRNQEKANYLKAQLEKDKAILNKKKLKQQIIIEIENAYKDIQYNYKRIEAAKATTLLQEEKLKAEEEKLAVGLSTNFYVLKYQEDLSIARTSELAAIIAYNKAIAQLEHAIGGSLKSLTAAR